MKDERKKLLAKLAYLYYVEDKSQSQIAAETGIYRTTVSRMLAEAKKEGVVKIEIENFDTRLFRLENYIKQKYGLKAIEIIPNLVDEVDILFRVLAMPETEFSEQNNPEKYPFF